MFSGTTIVLFILNGERPDVSIWGAWNLAIVNALENCRRAPETTINTSVPAIITGRGSRDFELFFKLSFPRDPPSERKAYLTTSPMNMPAAIDDIVADICVRYERFMLPYNRRMTARYIAAVTGFSFFLVRIM